MHSKCKHRARKWKQYNQDLVNRGSITFWFSPEAIAKWHNIERTNKPGRPEEYSDDAIRCGLIVKAVFHIAFRALQGFLKSLIRLLGLGISCPHYSLFCIRAKGLAIPTRKLLRSGEKLNVIFDSTGIKVFGEGEWKVRKHGYTKRRIWRKIHVGMCADTGQVVVSAITTNNVSDGTAMIGMLGALEGIPLGDVLGDMAYDTTDCRGSIYDLGGRQIIPPKKTARQQGKNPLLSLRERDAAIQKIKTVGRVQWKQEIGYHRRSLVETLMYRYKTILGDRLSSRKKETQTTEILVKLDVLNQMIELGMRDNRAN